MPEGFEIVPFLHPIYDTNERLRGYETLMRIEYGDKIISPYEILNRYFSSYDKIIRETHNKIFKNILVPAYKNQKDFFFSINISLKLDWENREIKNNLVRLFSNYSYLLKNVVIEIVEDHCQDGFNYLNDEKEIAYIEEINYFKKKYGFKIAIDDFGSGYSNFKRFFLLDADIVKIDGFLINNYSKGQIQKVLAKLKKMFQDKKIVFEYIDSDTKKQALKEYCDYMQGFLFSEPVSFKNIPFLKQKI